MYYFLTHKLYSPISAIEKMMLDRLNLFEAHDRRAVFVTRDYNRAVANDLAKFHLNSATYLNMYDYFQGFDKKRTALLPIPSVVHDQVMRREDGLQESWYLDGQLVAILQFMSDSKQLDTISHYDQFGKLSSVDLYDSRGWLSMTQLLNTEGQIVTQLFWTSEHSLAYMEQYGRLEDGRWGNRQMTLYWHGSIHHFHSMEELFAFFLDTLAKSDTHAVFFADRHETVVEPLCEMTVQRPRFLVMHSSHVSVPDDATSDLTIWVQKAEAAKFSGVIVSTEKQANDLRSRISIPISVVPVRYLRDAELTRSRVPFRRRPQHTVLVVARLSEEKRIGDAIQAVSMLKSTIPDVCLNVYGAPMAGYAEQRKLIAQVSQLGVQAHVNFRGFTDNLDKIYADGAVLVVTSRVEGFNVSILEALSYGLPVVTYAVNYGPTTLVQDGDNGVILTENNPEHLATALARCFDHTIDMQKLSDGAYQSCQQYAASSIWEQWLKVIAL